MPYNEMPEFQLPSFLHDQSAERIHQRMMEKLPVDMDDTPGGWEWDKTKPTALEKAELLEFFLPETIKMMFYMWADGIWLDHHARAVNLQRKPATHGSEIYVVEGKPGFVIPTSFAFATPSIGDSPSVVFYPREEAVIGPDGVARFQIVAEQAGLIGNVPSDSIVLMMTPVSEITSCTNPNAITGGVEEEDDESLRWRIDDKYKHMDETYIGNDWDYIRWAKEVPGVGSVVVIPIPEGRPGSVKVVVVDGNGKPANQMILDNVFDYIVSPEDRLLRKAPIEATVYVVAPSAKNITYGFLLVLEEGADAEVVKQAFSDGLADYYVELVEDADNSEKRVVRYNQVAAILTHTPGVRDFTNLLMNGAAQNIEFARDEYPVTEAINATLPEVVNPDG